MTAPIRLAVHGASGKMGQSVVRLAHEAKIPVVHAVGTDHVGRDVGELAGVGTLGVSIVSGQEGLRESGATVVVDFSASGAVAGLALACARAGVALVSGTTGLDDAGKAALDAASRDVPVLWEPNMSVGVHVLSMLVARATELLGEGFDVEITEAHHRAKVDAPSGTALRLAEVVARARPTSRLQHGREGRPGARDRAQIGMHAVRGGDVVGDHTVMFLGDGERIELTHRASNRDLFARGAVRAAAWISGRPRGRYTLGDVLG